MADTELSNRETHGRKIEKIDFDNIIAHIGGFGRYQCWMYILLCLPSILCAFHMMAGVFVAAPTDFRCLLPHESMENASFELSPTLKNISYPWDSRTGSWLRCERYDVDFADPYYEFQGNLSLTIPTVKCASFVYDKTTYELTVVTEFNLVCDAAWLGATTDSLFMVGAMLGSLITGELSDRYGRKPIVFLCLIVNFISGLLVAFSPETISYLITRFIVGFSIYGTNVATYVIVVEMVSLKNRLVAGVSMELFTLLGYFILGGFAYFIRNWKILQIAITIPSLAVIAYWWFTPESVRWLLSKGRLEEAKNLILEISAKNRVQLPRDKLDSMLHTDYRSKQDSVRTSVFDLLRYPKLRRKSLILFFNKFTISLTYFGLTWNTSMLGGNNYVNYAISGLVELPSYVFVLFTSNKLGRKIILCCSLLVAGILLLTATLIPDDMPWLVLVSTMIAKLAVTCSLSIARIVSAEQYPTVIRNIGVGACTTCALIGGIMAPILIHLSRNWTSLSFIVLGSASVLAGLLACFIPETLNKRLPNTIQESEQL